MKTQNVIFQYLNAENISLDKNEFDFQFNSHPDFPSLLALSDTLKFFDISNKAFKIEKEDINLLPTFFIALLKNEHSNYLSFVEKKENKCIYTNETDKKNCVLKQDFELLWGGIVLLAENDVELPKAKVKKRLTFLLPLLISLLIISISIINISNLRFLAFYIFPAVGFFLSVAALKDLFNANSSIFDKLCNVNSETSCKSVVDSAKWKIFDIVSFSDLSILFFTTQIFALFLMSISGNYLDYFYIQTLLLLSSVPLIIASLYYQKYIEKKWCSICLTIITVLLFEFGYLLYFNSLSNLSFSLEGSLLFALISSIMVAIWFPLKKILIRVNHLKDFELRANRFRRNYTIFKNNIVSKEKLALPSSPLIFGNQDAAIEISIITSPFCGYCMEPHYMLKSILENYSESVKISTIFNIHPKIKNLKEIAMNLINIQLTQGEIFYNKAMNEWYKNKDTEKWLEKFKTNSENIRIEQILKNQHEWCIKNNFNFTPCVFINGYEYPKIYEISDLPFFIDEIINDKKFYI